jgi:hypothetical protein
MNLDSLCLVGCLLAGPAIATVGTSTPAIGPSHVARGTPVVTDPAMLKALLLDRRKAIAELTVEYASTRWESAGAATDERWRVTWGDSGFAIRVTRPGGAGDAVDGTKRSWDLAAKQALLVAYDPADGVGEVQRAGSPSALNLSEFLPDYCGLLGIWPTRTISGGKPLNNDPAILLGLDDVVVLPTEELIEGHSCVVVERRGNSPSGTAVTRLRVALAPALNYAVVSTSVFGTSGTLISQYVATKFAPANAETIALPTEGVFRRYNGEGAVVMERFLVVSVLPDGSPLVQPGVGPSPSDLAMPAGYAVTDLDTPSPP